MCCKCTPGPTLYRTDFFRRWLHAGRAGLTFPATRIGGALQLPQSRASLVQTRNSRISRAMRNTICPLPSPIRYQVRDPGRETKKRSPRVRYMLCPIACWSAPGYAWGMRNVPPDEYNGAVAYLGCHGCRITPVDSFASGDPSGPCTRVGRKTLTAEEVVSLAVDKGWVLP